jgi:integrase/recombinase XerD
VEAILSVPDLTQWNGRRDHALLLTLYNSGAHVSEVISLRCSQAHFGTSAFLQLHGKGRKERTVPLWPNTANILKAWFRELEGNEDDLAFASVRGRPLTRNGVNYILQQAIASATEKQVSFFDRPGPSRAEALSFLVPTSDQPVTGNDEKRRHWRGHQAE